MRGADRAEPHPDSPHKLSPSPKPPRLSARGISPPFRARFGGRWLLLGAACALLAACGERTAANAVPLARYSLRGQLALLVVADVRAVPLTAGDTTALPANARVRNWILRDSLSGVRVQSITPALGGAIAQLRATAPYPLLVVADADTRRAGALPDALTTGDHATARRLGQQIGREARAAGVNLLLVRGIATNTDGPSPAPRRDGAEVAGGFDALLGGVRDAGVAATVHVLFAEADSTSAVVTQLNWDLARWNAIEFPFVRSVERSATALLLGSASAPALTGDTLPLPFSPAAISGVLRRDLGWEGPVLVDLGSTGPLAGRFGAGEAAVRAVAAGADLLLGVADPETVLDALTAAVRNWRLSRERVDAAALRVLRLRSPAVAVSAMSQPDPLPVGTDPAQARIAARRSPPTPEATVLRPAAAASVGMNEDALARRVDRLLRAAIRDSVFPGAALAIGRRGGLVRLRGYGMTSREPDARRVDAERTIYDLASLTKVVGTTAAAMLLVDAGRLALDAPVRRYLPEWSGPDKSRVTIRQLLTHTSGLPSGLWLFGSADSPADALQQTIRAPLVAPPGTRAEYSDLGMILLAEIVGRVANRPIDELLAAGIYAPLGMSQTGFLPPLVFRDRVAPSARVPEHEFLLQGVVHDANAFRLGGVAGHAGLFSTARDLAVFAQMMLNGGAYDGVCVVSEAVVDTFTTRQAGAGERALGWDIPSERSTAGRFFSARSFGHTGYTGTSLWIDPAQDLFVVLLTNRVYDRTSSRAMLRLRQQLHEAVARAITDSPVPIRPGAEEAQ